MILLALKRVFYKFWLLPLCVTVGTAAGRFLMGNSVSPVGILLTFAGTSLLIIVVNLPIAYHKIKMESTQ
jgi:hypothetical protein